MSVKPPSPLPIKRSGPTMDNYVDRFDFAFEFAATASQSGGGGSARIEEPAGQVAPDETAKFLYVI